MFAWAMAGCAAATKNAENNAGRRRRVREFILTKTADRLSDDLFHPVCGDKRPLQTDLGDGFWRSLVRETAKIKVVE
jgi:hypothetical protein